MKVTVRVSVRVRESDGVKMSGKEGVMVRVSVRISFRVGVNVRVRMRVWLRVSEG